MARSRVMPSMRSIIAGDGMTLFLGWSESDMVASNPRGQRTFRPMRRLAGRIRTIGTASPLRCGGSEPPSRHRALLPYRPAADEGEPRQASRRSGFGPETTPRPGLRLDPDRPRQGQLWPATPVRCPPHRGYRTHGGYPMRAGAGAWPLRIGPGGVAACQG